MKLRLRCLQYELKRMLLHFPQMFTGAIVLAVMAGAIAFCAVRMISEENSAPVVTVAVIPDDSGENVQLLLDFVAGMESTRDNFQFIVMDNEDAVRALDEGRVHAIMHFPERLIDGILDGSNRHVEVILSDSDILCAVLLQELSLAGAKTLSSAQSGVYTIQELYLANGLSESLSTAYLDLDIRNLQYALAREDLFMHISSEPTGTVPAQRYYLSAGLLFFLMMSGICYAGFYDDSSSSLRAARNSAHIGIFSEGFGRYLGLFLYQFCFCLSIVLLMGIFYFRQAPVLSNKQALSDGFRLFALLIVLALISAAYQFFLLEIAPGSGSAIVLLFVITAPMMLVSGCFIPIGLLPSSIVQTAVFLPIRDMMQLMFYLFSRFTSEGSFAGGIFLSGSFPKESVVHLLLFSILFLAFGLSACRYRRKRL